MLPMELIPGLIDDVGRECLIRIPYEEFPLATSICKSWGVEIQLPEFWQRRKASGLTRPVLIMIQAQSDPDEIENQDRGVGSEKCPERFTHGYGLTLCEPEAGVWSRMPSVPGFSSGLPMFCGVVGVGLDLVVIGGWDPVTWQPLNTVYVFNFLTARWRRGAGMPGGVRSFFGCAADKDGQTVLVAGGHDAEKNALKSAMLYDVAKDEWTLLPHMERARDECTVIFHQGKFHVISGYSTDSQGRFNKSVEIFDSATWQWDHLCEDFLEASTSPKACVAGDDGQIYMCRTGDVAVRVGERWKMVAELPADVGRSPYGVTWQDKLIVIGSSKFGEPYKLYVLDLKSYEWVKLNLPKSYCGSVQSGCTLEL